MAEFIAVHKWLDRSAEQIDPRSVQFTAVEARASDACKGCIFDRQGSAVCRQAEAIAMAADLPDCDAGFIYVLDRKTDPRQQRITRGGLNSGATEASPVTKNQRGNP